MLCRTCTWDLASRGYLAALPKLIYRMLRTAARLGRSAGLLVNQTAIVCTLTQYTITAALTQLHITGSSQGIRAECTKIFASEGARVTVCDMDATKADEVAQSINDVYPGHTLSVPGDVTDASYIPRCSEVLPSSNGERYISSSTTRG